MRILDPTPATGDERVPHPPLDDSHPARPARHRWPTESRKSASASARRPPSAALLPGGAGATLLYRPWWWLRFNGGLAYDVVGFGYRGGVSLAPGHWVVTPTLNFDAGHYVSGDATRFVSTSDPNEIALLHHATYDFGSAQIGLEIGSQRRFTFYLRGGVAYVRTHAAGSDLTNLVNGKSGSSASSYTVGDLNLSMLIPCVSLGFLIYIF